jgi:hypothetical protein
MYFSLKWNAESHSSSASPRGAGRQPVKKVPALDDAVVLRDELAVRVQLLVGRSCAYLYITTSS